MYIYANVEGYNGICRCLALYVYIDTDIKDIGGPWGVTLLELLNNEKCKMKWKQRSSARSSSFQCSCRRHVAVDAHRWVHLGVEVVALKLILRLGVGVLGLGC